MVLARTGYATLLDKEEREKRRKDVHIVSVHTASSASLPLLAAVLVPKDTAAAIISVYVL